MVARERSWFKRTTTEVALHVLITSLGVHGRFVSSQEIFPHEWLIAYDTPVARALVMGDRLFGMADECMPFQELLAAQDTRLLSPAEGSGLKKRSNVFFRRSRTFPACKTSHDVRRSDQSDFDASRRCYEDLCLD